MTQLFKPSQRLMSPAAGAYIGFLAGMVLSRLVIDMTRPIADALEAKALCIGLAMFVLSAAPVAGVYFARRLTRRNPYACLQCGYDLRRSESRCPECGADRTAVLEP